MLTAIQQGPTIVVTARCKCGKSLTIAVDVIAPMRAFLKTYIPALKSGPVEIDDSVTGVVIYCEDCKPC